MRVLLIEDDSATAQSVELMLKTESFNVYTTDLGEEGIDLGKVYDYDLILLDLNLPGLDGRRILMELRKDPLLRLIPVVVLSGSALEEDMMLAYELGANAYVVKPHELKRFRTVMRAICDFWCGAAAVPGRATR